MVSFLHTLPPTYLSSEELMDLSCICHFSSYDLKITNCTTHWWFMILTDVINDTHQFSFLIEGVTKNFIKYAGRSGYHSSITYGNFKRNFIM